MSTWNYLAVHATGPVRLVSEPARALEIMAATIAEYEAGYQPQWDRLPPDYQAGLLRGIVAFAVVISDLQGQQKLSQNKTAGEQQRIREALAARPDQAAREVAAYMPSDYHYALYACKSRLGSLPTSCSPSVRLSKHFY